MKQHNVQATPFDLALLTASIDESPSQNRAAYYRQVYQQLVECLKLFRRTNERLSRNPDLAYCRLKVPLTPAMFTQLRQIPSWAQANRDHNLRRLKIAVLSLLQNRPPTEKATIRLHELEIVHFYHMYNASNFFPPSLPRQLCDKWVEAAGACGFERGVSEPEVSPEPIHGVWVISARQESDLHSLLIRRALEANDDPEESVLPLLTQIDEWTWERLVREQLWQDTRLPFNGPHPDGPFGYRPAKEWQPGHRPISTSIGGVSGYKDALGGLWQWEGGRARTTTPFDGHWNVQLLNARAKQNWRRWLEQIYLHSEIRLSSNHINVEPDGRIVDRTFEVLQK